MKTSRRSQPTKAAGSRRASRDCQAWENRHRRNLINWALLVGCDAAARTYVVRHPVRDNVDYEVPFDGFGYLDPVSWYCALVPGEVVAVDRAAAAYRDEVTATRELALVCDRVRQVGAWDQTTRREAAAGIDAALSHERAAVAAIHEALAR